MYRNHPSVVRRAFTLVELVVVIGIIMLLIAIALPSLTNARNYANTVQCANNLRQLAMALIGYANENQGAFPPSSVETTQFWYQQDKIGQWITTPLVLSDGTLGNGVMRCPSDFDDAVRSYAMNVFADSSVSTFVSDDLNSDEPSGQLFKFGVADSSQMILLTDSWSELAVTPTGYAAEALIGWNGPPGARFGAGDGINWTGGRFGTRASQIDFSRHRTVHNRSMTDPIGAANFAFVDGHVALWQTTDLADFTTGKSRYVALWSEIDEKADSY
jgi:prepilin-type processing-associated H-X9-DG protein